MPRTCFQSENRVTLVAVGCILAVLSGCEPSGPAMTGSLLQGVNISVIHPYSAGGSDGNNDMVNAHGWLRVYWSGRNAGEVKIEIDRSNLRIDGQAFGKVESGDTVRIDVMNGVDVMVNGQQRRPPATIDDDPIR